MTYKIKRKYIYVFQLLSPFFTLYKIFCVCVLWIINVNQYSAMLYTNWKKKANRLFTRIHKVSPLSSNRYSNIHNLQHPPVRKWFDSDFPPWSNRGLSHGADYFSLSPRWIIWELKWHLHSDLLMDNIVKVIVAVRYCHQTRLPCWTNQRKIHTDSCSKQQKNGDFCIIDMYDHCYWANHYFVKVRLLDFIPLPKVKEDLYSIFEAQNIPQSCKRITCCLNFLMMLILGIYLHLPYSRTTPRGNIRQSSILF